MVRKPVRQPNEQAAGAGKASGLNVLRSIENPGGHDLTLMQISCLESNFLVLVRTPDERRDPEGRADEDIASEPF
jgi:hypothetical protein